MTITRQLNERLPPEFAAEPRVEFGSSFEGDGSSSEVERGESWTPAPPTVLIERVEPKPPEYEVLVFDVEMVRRLVAAIEIVSPGYKDNHENRKAFVSKCATFLQQGIYLVIIDVVTILSANLYCELAKSIGGKVSDVQGPNYAAGVRGRRLGKRWRVEAWPHELLVGKPLPTLPIWIEEITYVPLDLESTFEEACRALRIP